MTTEIINQESIVLNNNNQAKLVRLFGGICEKCHKCGNFIFPCWYQFDCDDSMLCYQCNDQQSVNNKTK